jgi:hypothetical protein
MLRNYETRDKIKQELDNELGYGSEMFMPVSTAVSISGGRVWMVSAHVC